MDSATLETLWYDGDARESLLRKVVSERLTANPPPAIDDAIVATYFFAFRTMKLEDAVEEISYHATSGIHHPPPGSLLDQCSAKPAGVDAFDATGRLGLLFHRPGAPDHADGYGYVQPAGRIGPVLVREPWMLQPALGELTGALEPMIAWQAVVPGIAAHALRPLLEGGLRIEGSPAVYAANWSGPPFERYLPMSFGLV